MIGKNIKNNQGESEEKIWNIRGKKAYFGLLLVLIFSAGIFLGIFLNSKQNNTTANISSSISGSLTTPNNTTLPAAAPASQEPNPAAQNSNSSVPLPTATIINLPSSVMAGDLFNMEIKFDSDILALIQNVGVNYSLKNISQPQNQNDFDYKSEYLCVNSHSSHGCNISASFPIKISIAFPGTYHVRAHGLSYGREVWSQEKTIEVSASDKPVKEINLTIGKNGFYQDNQNNAQVSAGGKAVFLKLTVPSDWTSLNIPSQLNSPGVDFRGCGQSVSATPGNTTQIKINPTHCIITAYYKDSISVIGGLEILP
jgi:hypothetical protein